jgi:hypothetical protein
MQTIGLVAVAYLAVSGFWTAHDPFVGKWKLDVSRSMIVDQMRVQSIGPNRYAFNFEGGPTETILADGTDQPGLPGTTLSVKAEDARTLKLVRKQDGRIVVSATWKLSEDGRSLRDAFTNVQPDGSTLTVNYVYRRMSGTSGIAGAWESTTKPVGLKFELGIEPYDGPLPPFPVADYLRPPRSSLGCPTVRHRPSPKVCFSSTSERVDALYNQIADIKGMA